MSGSSDRFDGRTALVTGGASGIGRACAGLLAARGAAVVIADRAGEVAEAVAGEIGGHALDLDIAHDEAVEDAAAGLWKEHGAVSVLVHAAGVLQGTRPPELTEQKEWDRVQNVNLRGAWLVNRALGTRMADSGGGSIVNIASVAGMTSGPLSSYAPAKAGLISLTQVLAVEWGAAGVRVNAVSPGFTTTPALDRGVELGVLDRDLLTGSTALGRLVAAGEIAEAVAFLASDRAAAVTGVNLPVDAGYLVGTGWHAYGGPRRAGD